MSQRTIGNLLKECRGELTQDQMGARLKLNRVNYNRMEMGHARVTIDVAVRLERAGFGRADMWATLQMNQDLKEARAG